MRKQLAQTDWERLEQLSDEDIDYSDIPVTDEAFWEDAEVIFPTGKVHLSIRLDEDIVDWFKQFGRGYQTRINAVLRSYIRAMSKR